MIMMAKTFYIFLKDEEIVDFCIYVNNQLLLDSDVNNLSKAIKERIGYNYALCSITVFLYKNYSFSLEILPILKVMPCEYNNECLLFKYRHHTPEILAMNFELAKKQLGKILQCDKII